MIEPHLTSLIHGESKVGKTWLASTAPKPLVVLDAEAGGMRFVPGAKRMIQWDPDYSPPPQYIEDENDPDYWTICRVNVHNELVLDNAIAWLIKGQHDFASVVIDSVTELQNRIKRGISSAGDLRIQDWGRLLTKIENLIEQCRDMADIQPQMKAFVCIAGSRMKDGKMRPMMQGQIAEKMPYKVDACGYLQIMHDDEGNVRRVLQLIQGPNADCGNRLGGTVPDYVWDPNITDILQEMTDNINKMESE